MKILEHGTYVTKTAFDMKGHDYAAAGHTNYVELLEVLDPPSGKERFVINHYNIHSGYNFCETRMFDLAREAFMVVANGLVNNIPEAWKQLGIEKMYTTKSSVVEPWFYSKSKELFGRENEFSTIKELTDSHGSFSKGSEYLVFLEKTAFSFESVAGIYDDNSVIWESSKSSSVHSLRVIDAHAHAWKDQQAVVKWMKFLSSGNSTVIEIEFPIWTLILNLSIEFETVYLKLTVKEEFKGVKSQQDYWKDKETISKKLISTSQYFSRDFSLVDVVKFFISE